MNIHEAKRVDRCREITFALRRVGGANSAGKGKYYATMGHGIASSNEALRPRGTASDIRILGL